MQIECTYVAGSTLVAASAAWIVANERQSAATVAAATRRPRRGARVAVSCSGATAGRVAGMLSSSRRVRFVEPRLSPVGAPRSSQPRMGIGSLGIPGGGEPLDHQEETVD